MDNNQKTRLIKEYILKRIIELLNRISVLESKKFYIKENGILFLIKEDIPNDVVSFIVNSNVNDIIAIVVQNKAQMDFLVTLLQENEYFQEGSIKLSIKGQNFLEHFVYNETLYIIDNEISNNIILDDILNNPTINRINALNLNQAQRIASSLVNNRRFLGREIKITNNENRKILTPFNNNTSEENTISEYSEEESSTPPTKKFKVATGTPPPIPPNGGSKVIEDEDYIKRNGVLRLLINNISQDRLDRIVNSNINDICEIIAMDERQGNLIASHLVNNERFLNGKIEISYSSYGNDMSINCYKSENGENLYIFNHRIPLEDFAKNIQIDGIRRIFLVNYRHVMIACKLLRRKISLGEVELYYKEKLFNHKINNIDNNDDDNDDDGDPDNGPSSCGMCVEETKGIKRKLLSEEKSSTSPTKKFKVATGAPPEPIPPNGGSKVTEDEDYIKRNGVLRLLRNNISQDRLDWIVDSNINDIYEIIAMDERQGNLILELLGRRNNRDLLNGIIRISVNGRGYLSHFISDRVLYIVDDRILRNVVIKAINNPNFDIINTLDLMQAKMIASCLVNDERFLDGKIKITYNDNNIHFYLDFYISEDGKDLYLINREIQNDKLELAIQTNPSIRRIHFSDRNQIVGITHLLNREEGEIELYFKGANEIDVRKEILDYDFTEEKVVWTPPIKKETINRKKRMWKNVRIATFRGFSRIRNNGLLSGLINLSHATFRGNGHIEIGALSGCEKLTYLNFPEIQYLSLGTFYNIPNLVEINIPKIETIEDRTTAEYVIDDNFRLHQDYHKDVYAGPSVQEIIDRAHNDLAERDGNSNFILPRDAVNTNQYTFIYNCPRLTIIRTSTIQQCNLIFDSLSVEMKEKVVRGELIIKYNGGIFNIREHRQRNIRLYRR